MYGNGRVEREQAGKRNQTNKDSFAILRILDLILWTKDLFRSDVMKRVS